MTQQQIEFACKEVVFHFNKQHLQDETIPMWVLKFHGETYYVNHVDSQLPWSTKETPNNPSTKGSIKFKNALVTINEQNESTLTELTIFDKIRLRNQKLGITRIMCTLGSDMHKALERNEFKHSPFKIISAPCTARYVICDLLQKEEVTFAALKYDDFRIVKENEYYYKEYDMVKGTRITANYSDPNTRYEYS